MESKEGRRGGGGDGGGGVVGAGRGDAEEQGTKEGQESDFLRWPAVMRRQMCRLQSCEVQTREEKRSV